MLLSPRKDGLGSLFKEVRVFKVLPPVSPLSSLGNSRNSRNYRPFPVEKLTEKGILPAHRPGVPRTPSRQGGSQEMLCAPYPKNFSGYFSPTKAVFIFEVI